MSDDWQIGDLAVCVDNGAHEFECRAHQLIIGRAYKVAKIGVPKGSPTGLLCLAFWETPTPGDAFHADRFRKILPDQHEPCEAEFVTLLKRTKVGATLVAPDVVL